jgi:F-type H+-transporting ATPase subunit delta
MQDNLLSSKVVEPYAEALMSIAQSTNLTEQFGEDFRNLLSVLDASPELRSFIESPLIKGDDKKAIIRRLAGENTSPVLVNFLLLLVDRRRIVFLEVVARKYLELLRKLNNIALAIVTTAQELTEDQRQTLIEKVKQMTGANGVDLEVTVDPDLIGGVIVKVGSQVVDASLRGQLRRISLSLSKAS